MGNKLYLRNRKTNVLIFLASKGGLGGQSEAAQSFIRPLQKVEENERINMSQKPDNRIEIAFCEGFAYGARYGYEDRIDGSMSHTAMSSHWVRSGNLFRRLHPRLARPIEECSIFAEELEAPGGQKGEK
jgi:hypothetical protein